MIPQQNFLSSEGKSLRFIHLGKLRQITGVYIDQISATWPLWKNFLLPKPPLDETPTKRPYISRWHHEQFGSLIPCINHVPGSVVIQVMTIRGKGQFSVHGIPCDTEIMDIFTTTHVTNHGHPNACRQQSGLSD